MSAYDDFDPFAALVGEAEEDIPVSASHLAVASTHTLLGNYQEPDYSVSDRIANAGKFAVSAMYSGIDSIANTAIEGYNFFGSKLADEFEKVDTLDTAQRLTDIDSDLGAYYLQNKEGADFAGFLVTSLVPGLAGVKALNFGQKVLTGAIQTGKIGGTTAKLTGLLAPQADLYIAKAATDIAKTQATFAGINVNLAKGIGAGFGQATLESAAFEVAVVSTMNQSPILEDQDVSDLAANILVGGAVGGVIGGVLSTAKAFGVVKSIVKSADEAEKPFTQITELPSAASATDRVIQRFDDLENMPKPPTEGDFALKYNRLASDKAIKLQTLVRKDLREISSDDMLGNMVADAALGMNHAEATSSLFGVKQFARVGVKTDVEKAIEKQTGVLLDIDNPVLPDLGNKSVKYIQLIGDSKGAVADAQPKVLHLADRYAGDADVMKYVNARQFKTSKVYDARKDTNHFHAEARQIWAAKVAKLKPGSTVGAFDLPLLEQAMENNIPVVLTGTKRTLNSADDIKSYLITAKQDTIKALLAKGTDEAGNKLSTEAIAKITNVRKSFIEGDVSTNELDDMFAKQYYDKKYTAELVKAGRHNEAQGVIDTQLLPRWAKAAVDYTSVADVDGNLLQGMAYVAAKSKLLQQEADNVFSNHVPQELVKRFDTITDADMRHASRYGAGSGRISFSNGNYGSFESKVESIGAATQDLIINNKAAVRDTAEPIARKLANNPQAALEFETINQITASTSEKYILDIDNMQLVSRSVKEYEAAIAAGNPKAKPPVLQKGAPIEIPITHPETMEAIKAHVALNGNRVNTMRQVRAVQGLEDSKDAATFYPMRPDPQDYKYFAFVVDPKVTGVGHMKMIHAMTPDDLRALIEKVPGDFKVITDKSSKDWHEALGDYKWERTLHESYIDSSLESAGVNSQFFLKTDPVKIAEDWMEHHLRREAVVARELVNLKYEKYFAELQRLGEQYTNIATSKYASRWDAISKQTKNPYLDYVKTALNVSRVEEYPLLRSLNKTLSDAVTSAYESMGSAFAKTKSVEELEGLNESFKQYGIQSAFNNDAIVDLIVNKHIPRDVASKFVRTANKILSTTLLRLDILNAATNAIGANVLLGSETRYVLSQIQRGNKKAVGELAELLNVNVPGVSDQIRSPAKLIANSMRSFFDKSAAGVARKAEYTNNGWIRDISAQIDAMLDDITPNGTETAAILQQKTNAAYQKAKELVAVGEKYTGNKVAEEFNRFVAADVMRQITDIAVKHNILTPKQQISYINTFVNRTQGNIMATQRPMMFQGPIGQAVGLFQTYQFNLIQQLLRYVAEGTGKDVATLLGLQATIFGINGLPAFNFINTHVVGNASGNERHRDLYTSVYGVVGKQAGDWLLYGAPSNLLHTSIYTRGDINPRHLTIIPTNPADIPIVNATASFYKSMKQMTTTMAGGGNVWQALLQGVEHNTLSRPLAGLAQTLQAISNPGNISFSTSGKGNILGSNDLFSLANISRLAGGKPLDEAILNDAMFRTTVYKAKDTSRKQQLARELKSTAMAGNVTEPEDMVKFAERYAAMGGDQKSFNKWALRQIASSNTEKAAGMIGKLSTPESQYLQIMLSGSTFDKLPPAGDTAEE